MPWKTFLDSLTAWQRGHGQRQSPAAFAAYLADRHDITRREANEVIEDWATLTRKRAPALSP